MHVFLSGNVSTEDYHLPYIADKVYQRTLLSIVLTTSIGPGTIGHMYSHNKNIH